MPEGVGYSGSNVIAGTGLDLNYIGNYKKEGMLKEKPIIARSIQAVCERENYTVRRTSQEHAGEKWMLRYQSALGQGGNLAIDINFMFRIPLWPVATMDSKALGSYSANQIPIVDLHEITAGKIAALLSRNASRDLFDVHSLLTSADLYR